MTKKRGITAGILIGSGMILAMLFANQLGLDNNSDWGTGRFVFLFAGILILTTSLFYRRDNLIGKAFHTYTGQLYLSVGIIIVSIITLYIWITSMGLWTTWPNRTSYYDLLATAFSHGQTALVVQPDPALLALENPYELSNRDGTPLLMGCFHLQRQILFILGACSCLTPDTLQTNLHTADR